MIARFRTRAARLVSLDAVTVEPFSRVEAQAMASRRASSGPTSTFARPVTPWRPKRLLAPRDSRTMEVLTVAPISTVLNGKTLMPAFKTAAAPTKTSSPSTTPSSRWQPWRRSQARPTTEPSTRTPEARWLPSWTTLRSTAAFSPTRTFGPRTV